MSFGVLLLIWLAAGFVTCFLFGSLALIGRGQGAERRGPEISSSEFAGGARD